MIINLLRTGYSIMHQLGNPLKPGEPPQTWGIPEMYLQMSPLPVRQCTYTVTQDTACCCCLKLLKWACQTVNHQPYRWRIEVPNKQLAHSYQSYRIRIADIFIFYIRAAVKQNILHPVAAIVDLIRCIARNMGDRDCCVARSMDDRD